MRTRAKSRIAVCIISARRPGNVMRMEELVGSATWYVANGDRKAYMEAGARKVVEAGALCQARNAALRAAWEDSRICVQLSDDLKKIEKIRETIRGRKTEPIAFRVAVEEIVSTMERTGARLGGVAPTGNAFYFTPKAPVKTRAFVVGDFIVVMPCDVLFDETLRLKEDYDYTVAHVQRYGKVARNDAILATFSHRKNTGGAVSYRTPEEERKAIRRLREKWGGVIRMNPRRENEILLRFPR